jgi:hypothetical protein
MRAVAFADIMKLVDTLINIFSDTLGVIEAAEIDRY